MATLYHFFGILLNRILANYIVWSVIQDEVPYLSKKFLKARMRYKEKILGSKGLRKRWKTCVSYTNEYLGEILGALYIKQRPNNKFKAIVSLSSWYCIGIERIKFLHVKLINCLDRRSIPIEDSFGL